MSMIASTQEMKPMAILGALLAIAILLWVFSANEVLISLAILLAAFVFLASLFSCVYGIIKKRACWGSFLYLIAASIVWFGIKWDSKSIKPVIDTELSSNAPIFKQCCNSNTCGLLQRGWGYVGNGFYTKKIRSGRMVTKLVYSPWGEGEWRVSGSMLLVHVKPQTGKCSVSPKNSNSEPLDISQ